MNGQATCPGCQLPFGGPVSHQFTFTGGSATGTTFRIPQGDYFVGREVISPRDGCISRQHMRVWCNDGCVWLEDANSTNRTYVGHEFASYPVRLTTGQQIWIGGNTAVYTITSNPQEIPA